MPRKRRNPNPLPKANRVDLNQSKAPTAVPTGLPYGQAGQLERQMAAAPLAQAGQPGGFDAVMAAAASHPGGEGLVGLDAPSTRPQQPVTAGLSIGAGPGPEVLGRMAPPAGRPRLAPLLTQMGDDTDNPRIQYLGYLARQIGL